MSYTLIYVISCVHLSDWLGDWTARQPSSQTDILRWSCELSSQIDEHNCRHCVKTSTPNVLIPAMLIGPIDSHHSCLFLWPWPWQRVTSSAESKIYWPHFSHNSQLIRIKFDMIWKHLNWTSWTKFWVKFIRWQEITTVLLCSNEENCWFLMQIMMWHMVHWIMKIKLSWLYIKVKIMSDRVADLVQMGVNHVMKTEIA